MKRIYNLLLIMLVPFIFFSCNKRKDYINTIPADADFVLQINPKTLAEKADLNQLEQYQITKQFLQNSATFSQIIDQIKKDPSTTGLDLITPIYIFGKKLNNKIVTSTIIKMDDKDNFEKQLKNIYQSIYNQSISFEEENNYTFIKGHKKPFVAWNKDQLIFIAGEYGTKTKTLNEYFNHLTTHETPLIKQLYFSNFVKKGEDISFWYTGKFLKYFKYSNQKQVNLDNSSWSNYLSFNQDNISYVQEFHPDAEAKIYFSKHPIWKKNINTNFYQYAPAKSYINFSFALHPKNINTIFNNNNALSKFLSDYQINYNSFISNAEGEALFSIFEIDKINSYNTNNYFNRNKPYKSYDILPQFIFMAKMKNDIFYKELIQTFGTQIKQQDQYHFISLSNNHTLYFTYKHNLIYLTNNYTQIRNFVQNKINPNNFLKSEYASGAKNAFFFNANLNLDDYSNDTKEYIFQQIPLGQTPLIQNFLNQFNNLTFTVKDNYHKTGVLNLKKQNQNSLAVVLKFIDGAYITYTNNSYNDYE